MIPKPYILDGFLGKTGKTSFMWGSEKCKTLSKSVTPTFLGNFRTLKAPLPPLKLLGTRSVSSQHRCFHMSNEKRAQTVV